MPSRAEEPRVHDDDLKLYGAPGDVSPWDVRFELTDRRHCEPLEDGRFRLRVWSEPSLVSMSVVTRLDGTIVEWPMESIPTSRFSIWETVIGPFDQVVQFSLAARSESGRPVYITKHGVASAVERLDRWSLAPREAIGDVPGWAKGAFMYQIFPERFSNGDESNDPVGVVAWGSEPEPHQYQGGDLQGVTAHLDHLAWLGVDLVYLNPVFSSPSNHKYDTTDYLSVDPAFGGDEALRILVAAAHARGMRVMLDASLNHVHPKFFAFADVVEHGVESKYADWFVLTDTRPYIGVRRHLIGSEHRLTPLLERWPDETGLRIVELEGDGREIELSFDAWYGTATMPRLNLANPEARRYALNVTEHWIREFEIDGWRMDVARYVDHDFWSDFRAVAKAANPNVHLITEIMGDAGAWLQGDTFDGTMNYTFRDLCLRFLANDEIDGIEFLEIAARMVFQYSWSATLASQNLIGSHDTPRFLTEAGGEEWRIRLATALQFTMPGMPGVYYGDEMEMTGGPDPGCRGAFPWGDDTRSVPTAQLIHDLSELRRHRRELVDGLWRPVGAGPDHVAFERIGEQSTLVVVNRGASTIELSLDDRWRDVIFGDGMLIASGLTVGPRSVVLLSS